MTDRISRNIRVLMMVIGILLSFSLGWSRQKEAGNETADSLPAPTDTLRQSASSPTTQANDPDESAMIIAGQDLMLISMLFLMLAFLAFGVSMAVAVLFALFAFTAWGLISTSVIVGLYQRSFRKGFRLLLLLVGGLLGAIVSTVGWWILVRRFRLPENGFLAYLLAASAGLLGGLLLGWITEWIVNWLLHFFKRQLFKSND